MKNHSRVKAMKITAKGFTLVELMITLAVLAILVTIGYPLYNVQLEKARRVDARSGLAKLAMAQERHYAMFGSYAVNTAELDYGPDGLADGVNDTFAYREAISDIDYDGNGSADNYNIVLTTDGNPATQDYLITATAIGTQLGDEDCRTFTINQVGVKTAADSGTNDQTDRCW
jgi:type IV pilus assembly protein PilE